MTSPFYIKWQSLSSLDFDLYTELSIGSGDNGNTSTFLNRESVSTEHFDGRRTIHRLKYQDVLTPTITLVKQDYGNFSQEENRKILSWLTSSDQPGWLEIYHDDSNVLSYQCFGNWTEIEQYKLANGRVIGYVCSFESSAPYAYSSKLVYPEIHDDIEEVTNNNEINDYLTVFNTETFNITCNTDEYNKPLYPKVTLTFKGKNEYFPVDVNPLQENTYSMVPNVIYSWNEQYRKAVDYTSGTIYYSDKNGAIANPQPTSATEITNGDYYIYVNKTHLYVNLNGDEDSGKYEIQALVTTPTANGNFVDYKYYYFQDDGYIKKLVVDSDGVTYAWKSIAKVGMAVKVSNSYTINGALNTKEMIVAGGTMDETIVLDGMNKIISGTKGITTRIIGDDFNWEWIPFAAGENNIIVTGNCQIKFEWFEPRKVGSL